jgi:hypothetical protein
MRCELNRPRSALKSRRDLELTPTLRRATVALCVPYCVGRDRTASLTACTMMSKSYGLPITS